MDRKWRGRNAPEVSLFDSTAISDRPQPAAVDAESINLSEYLERLRPGNNILAIQGLNDAIDSKEFLISAELLQTQVANESSPVFFRDPTPGEYNTTPGTIEFLHDDVRISEAHGFYAEAFETELIAEQGTSIRYTLDGSLPTAENGIDYAGPITIDRTTTIRARSFKDQAEPSNPVTATYLFIDDITRQTNRPEGWPRSSINGQSLDYGMDTDITDSDEWGPQLEEALTQVPTMSIVMDLDDLLSANEGIYTNASSHGRDWERPASLELINPDGSEGFQQDMGIRVRGGFSRRGSNPKHAFRLFFREDYGAAKLDFPLFGDEGTDSFDKIDLRTTQNYSWSFQGDGRNTFLRDVFSRDIQGQMGQPYTRSDYYHLYINGRYWGLFQTQERAEARYAASYFGGDSDDYDVVKSAGSVGGYVNEATDGNLNAYSRLWSFFQDGGIGDDNMAGYWQAQGMNPDGTPNPDFERLLDVDNLIDYMIITYFTSDADGPGSRFTRPRVNNYFAIYNRENPDGFKFFEHDSEHSLDTGNAAGANYNLVSPQLGDFVGSTIDFFNPHWMHEQLANSNSVYRERFEDAVYNRLFNDGPLAPQNALATLDARAAQIDMAIIAESARWGDAQRGSPYTKDDWLKAVDATRSWIGARTDTVIEQLQDAGWYPADNNPPQFVVNRSAQHGGNVTTQDSVSFVSKPILNLETVIPKGAVWSYLDDGTDQGSAWRNPDFDGAHWKTGAAKLAYGETDAITELDSGEGTKHLTAYFRTTFNVDDPAKYAGGLLQILRDDGAVIYLNGQEIGRSNMPSGPIDFETLASRNVTREEDTFFELDFLTNALRSGVNTVAVEVHQYRASSSSSADLAFDMELQIGDLSFENAEVYYTLDGSDPKTASGEPSPRRRQVRWIGASACGCSQCRRAQSSGRRVVIGEPSQFFRSRVRWGRYQRGWSCGHF